MAQTKTQNTETEIDDLDVEALEPDADVEDVEETDGETEEKTEKAKKGPTKGDLPEGVVTPIGFAKIVGERGLHTDREGNVVKDVKPQMVYSYMKNSPKDDRLETHEVEDSNGTKRQVLNVDEAIAWWERKNERAATRKSNAAEKAAKAAKKAETKSEETEGSPTEAEDGGADEAE